MSRQLPATWSLVNLGDCLIRNPEYGANSPGITYSNELPRYVRITDIDKNGNLIKDEKKSVSIGGNEKYIIEDGDFLFARTGATVGKTYLYNPLDGWLVYAGYLIRFQPDPAILLPKYLKNYTETYGYWYWVKSTTKTGAQPNINAKEYSSLPIPLPPLDEQLKISQILSIWDNAISKTEQLIAALELRKKGLMQSLLTGVVRFPGFSKDWNEVKLGDLFSARKETGYEDLPLLSVTNNGIIPREELDRKDSSNSDKSKYLRICPGDIGYNTMRMWQGRSALSQLEGIVSPAYTILKPLKSVDVKFMSYLFKQPEMINEFYRYSQGLVSDTWTLRYSNFEKIKTNIPDKEEQMCITELLSLCDNEIEHQKAKERILMKQKKGLMQRLLTGQVRVKVEE